jgi:hypothetical protein
MASYCPDWYCLANARFLDQVVYGVGQVRADEGDADRKAYLAIAAHLQRTPMTLTS